MLILCFYLAVKKNGYTFAYPKSQSTEMYKYTKNFNIVCYGVVSGNAPAFCERRTPKAHFCLIPKSQKNDCKNQH